MILKFIVFISLTLFFFLISIKKTRKRTHKVRIQNGRQFEVFLCELFRRAGYKVNPTGFSHDFGADLLIETRGKLIVLQAKYYNRPIDTNAVEEAVVAATIYGTSYVGIVTNGQIPDRVKQFAEQIESRTFIKKVYLIDGTSLERLKRGEKII